VPCTGFGFTLASIKAEFQQRTCVGEALNDAVHETLQNNATDNNNNNDRLTAFDPGQPG